MTAFYAAVTTLLVTLVIVALALFVSSKRFPTEPAATATARIYGIRAVYFVIISAVAVLSLAFTLPRTPYRGMLPDQKADAVVSAVGEMWAWTLTPTAGAASADGNLVLPVGKLVDFEVTSKDVNHNFGIYNSAGELIAQVQAMPDYTNRLSYRFDAPGHYYVLCLEFCGIAHHGMAAEFDVK